MPIYEFYCPDCHMIFQFYSRTVNTDKRPDCPGCKKTKLLRHMSLFSSPRKRDEGEDKAMPDMEDDAVERAMSLLSKEAQNIDENDPKQAAGLMRKLVDVAGLSPGPAMEDAIHRMEKGEDPETIEEEMGDLLDGEEPFEMKRKLGRLSKSAAPQVDDKIYDL